MGEIDTVAVHELGLWIDNDHDTYRRALLPVYANLFRHYRKGRFDYELAVRGMGYAVAHGAKRYHLEFGSSGDRWFDMFPKQVRDSVARVMVDYFLELVATEDGVEFLESL